MGAINKKMVIDANTLVGAMWPLERRDVSLEKLKREMDKFGVTKAVTLSAKGIFYDHTLGNDETLKVCLEDPRFIPALTIDPRKYLGYAEEIKKRIGEGFKILRLFPDFQGFMINSIHVRRIITKAEELGLPVMMPVKAGITNVLELLRELRGLRVILTGVTYFDLAEILTAMEESDNLFIETRLLDSPDGVSMVVEEFGASRLIFGSGAPLGYVGSSLNLIKHAQISEAEKRMVLAESVKKIIEGR